MRWLWTILILAALGAGAWFGYDYLKNAETQNEAHFIPSTAWLIFEGDSSQTNSFLLEQLLDEAALSEVERLVKESKSDRWMLFESESPHSFGIILYSKSGVSSERLNQRVVTSDFTVHLSSPVSEIENHIDESLIKKAQRVKESYCLLRTSSAINRIQDYFPSSTSDLLTSLIEDSWVTLHMNESEKLVQIDGISNSKSDNSSLPSSSALFRYLPAQCNAALIVSTDSVNATLIASIPDQSTGKAFILLGSTRFDNQMTDEVGYNGIPIGISSVKNLSFPFNPDWKNEAYYGDFGSIFLFTETESQLTSIIDDYAADDVLTRSIYYRKLEGSITDAQFSFYVRPQASNLENELVEVSDSEHGINSIIFQSHSEIPFQTFYNLAVARNEELRDQCPVLWSMFADSEIIGGPWKFQNHYSGKEEIVFQDATNQLYLINHEGKTLWKKQLESPLNHTIQMVDLYANGKYQMLFTTTENLQAIDRNGNNVPGFPIKLKEGTTGPPSLIRYEKNGDARILVSDGKTLKNFDQDGKAVKGWKNPEFDGQLKLPAEHKSFKGKDYIMAFTTDHKIHFLDRRGKSRQNDQQIATGLRNPEMYIGSNLASCYITGYDSVGNIYAHHFDGKESTSSILPSGTGVGTELIDPTQKTYAIIKSDRLFYSDINGEVSLDYLLPESIETNMCLIDASNHWIALSAQNSNNTYIVDLEGKMLDRMPITGSGKAILLDVDQNDVPEVCIGSENGELILYQLTN